MMKTEVRPLSSNELEKVVDYFLNFTLEEDLLAGADRKNYPSREKWIKLLLEDAKQPLRKRRFFYLGWFLEGKLIGHCNINNIEFGEEAYIHIHLWDRTLRRQGLATCFLMKAVNFYFKYFTLHKIISEPKSDNIGSKKTLQKCGFSFLNAHVKKPDMLSIEHEVSHYELLKANL